MPSANFEGPFATAAVCGKEAKRTDSGQNSYVSA